jgi:hypothetical protein
MLSVFVILNRDMLFALVLHNNVEVHVQHLFFLKNKIENVGHINIVVQNCYATNISLLNIVKEY